MSMEEQIKSKLEATLRPQSLILINDSHRHKGHAGDDGSGETHFRLTIVSQAFDGQSRVARQRMIYDLLGAEFKAGLHALSIRASTPVEEMKNNTP